MSEGDVKVSPKDIIVKVIDTKTAVPFVKKNHYSGKVVNNSSLHFGAFLRNNLHGVASFGPSLDKAKMINLIYGLDKEPGGFNAWLELNRLACDSVIPRNGESRFISQCIKLIKRNAPHIKFILSFADGCSCGTGTIYQASNFHLIKIKKNTDLIKLPDGSIVHKLSIATTCNKKLDCLGGKSFYDVTAGTYSLKKFINAVNSRVKDGNYADILTGFQLLYIYFIDQKYKPRLTLPIIPFSKIDELGIGMYKGEKIGVERHRKCEAQLRREAEKKLLKQAKNK